MILTGTLQTFSTPEVCKLWKQFVAVATNILPELSASCETAAFSDVQTALVKHCEMLKVCLRAIAAGVHHQQGRPAGMVGHGPPAAVRSLVPTPFPAQTCAQGQHSAFHLCDSVEHLFAVSGLQKWTWRSLRRAGLSCC